MRVMFSGAGEFLNTLPTGETRRYEFYIVPILQDLVDQGVLRVVHEGGWNSMWDRSRYRVVRGADPHSAQINLGYLDEAREALPIFTTLRQQASGPLALQIGIPTPRSLAVTALGVRGLRRHPVFTEATIQHITQIQQLTGSDVVFQLEATAEMVLAALAQPVHRAVDRIAHLAQSVAELAAGAPPGTRFGIHLCLGSLRNRSELRLRSTRPLVDLANSLVRHWPADRPLEYLHGPLASVDRPAPENPTFYAPLADLALPENTRFYAGIVQAQATDAQHARLLALAEDALGRPVDGVATACGLGRGSRVAAEDLLTKTVTLATTPPPPAD